MNKPLVTIAIITYNQEKYVREAVKGLLSQTYEPLEILISDDHSTDQTWNVIKEEVDAYRSSGGVHVNIVLNRNESNLGIAKNFALVTQLAHGELVVSGAGDDISYPNRVERIVEEWEKSERRATRIDHQAVKMDLQGKTFGLVSGYDKYRPLGAAMTYHRSVFEQFNVAPMPKDAYEDVVYGMRALMIGEYISLPDELVKYRVGEGVSTSLRCWRMKKGKMFHCAAISFQFALEELETYKGRLPVGKYEEIRDCVNKEYVSFRDRSELYGGKTFGVRLNALRKIHPPLRSMGPSMLMFFLVQVLALFPCRLSDKLADEIMSFKYKMKIRKNGGGL